MAETQEKSVVESDGKEKIGNTINQLWTYSTDSSSTMVTTGVGQGTGDKG